MRRAEVSGQDCTRRARRLCALCMLQRKLTAEAQDVFRCIVEQAGLWEEPL